MKGKCFFYGIILPIEPVFAFYFPFAAMDMNGFMTFIGIEEKPPPKDQ